MHEIRILITCGILYILLNNSDNVAWISPETKPYPFYLSSTITFHIFMV